MPSDHHFDQGGSSAIKRTPKHSLQLISMFDSPRIKSKASCDFRECKGVRTPVRQGEFTHASPYTKRAHSTRYEFRPTLIEDYENHRNGMHDTDRHFLHRLEKIAIFNHTYDLPRRHRELCAYGSRNSPTSSHGGPRRQEGARNIDGEMLTRNLRKSA